MGIFTRNERDQVATTDGTDDVETRDEPLERERVVEDHRSDWGGPPLVRALFTLLGVAAAGLLIWIASTFELTSTSEFWYAMGLIAAAGLALGLSQLFGGWTKWGIPVLSPGVFLLAFIPTLIVAGWILLTVQPDGGWQHDRFAGWTGDLGITGLVNDLGTFPAALAMGAGLVLAFSFDTTGPRRHKVVDREREVVPDEDVHDYSDDRPVVTDDSEVVTTPADDRTVTTTTPAAERTTVRDRDADTT
jgi:hypothetical protein